MIAPVGCVAVPAVFLHGGMFPEARASLVGVAGVAQLVDRIGPDHLRAEGAVLIVAVDAGDTTLLHRVMGLPESLRPDEPVAAPAEIGKGVLEVPGFAGMDAVAAVAGDILPAVAAHVPGCQGSELLVATQAMPGFLPCIRRPLAEYENSDALSALVFHVGGPGTVAGLAAVLGGEVTRHELLAVDGGGVAHVAVGMAQTADFGSHRPGRLGILARQEQDGPGEQDCEGCENEQGMSAPHDRHLVMQEKR